MFPGHFKIVGHSGTEFRNRKAFKKVERLNKVLDLKYGDQYGKEKFNVDKRRMAEVEKERKRKVLINGVLFFCIVFVIVMGVSYFFKRYLMELSPVIVKDKYEWQIHGSEATLKGIEKQDTLEQQEK